MMKGSHGAQVSLHNKGLFLEENWFIILRFHLRSCHGTRPCTHPPCYSSVCGFCHNLTWWEYQFPVEIPGALVFDQNKPGTLLFCTPIWFGDFTDSQIHAPPLAPGGVKGHNLVSWWAHILKTYSVRFFDSHMDSEMQPSKPRGPCRLPFGEWYFQTMLASGRPTAWHMRLTLLPSLTVTSLDTLVILAGTRERRKQIKIDHWSLIKDVSSGACWSRWSDRWWG